MPNDDQLHKDTAVLVFAYKRTGHLSQLLSHLLNEDIDHLYVFIDGPKSDRESSAVNQVHALCREICGASARIVKRDRNWGLGPSIMDGVSAVLKKHEAVVVFEDDLCCSAGVMRYFRQALEKYKNEEAVMSVTGWINPRAVPSAVSDRPYFDGRAECWSWGCWRRSWEGMDQSAQSIHDACITRGIDPNAYGADLVRQADFEASRKTWAARWSLLHILRGCFCLRPHYPLVENRGFDDLATNTSGHSTWGKPLELYPYIDYVEWPEVAVEPECSLIWKAIHPEKKIPAKHGLLSRVLHKAKRIFS